MHVPWTARRRDLIRAGVAGSALGLAPLAGVAEARGEPAVVLVADPSDATAATAPVQWALGALSDALTSLGATVRRADSVAQARRGDLCVIAAGAASPTAAQALASARVSLGEGSERLALLSARVSGRDVRVACGSDARGLMYALLELADRVRTGAGVAAALALRTPSVEAPANPVRSVMRQFVSEPLDKGWFADREMWPHYLGMLANSRFNRLHLAFGLGYDMLQRVSDSYMLFVYPFLVDAPGYQVRVTNLSAEQREANLAMLRFISDAAVERGLVFQLGIWMHGYELNNSPDARYIVEGLTPETHAAYCRDALAAVLKACPSISSVALRIHGESGVAEGSYDFWQAVFEGVPASGRVVEIDLHAKGVDATMIDRALATGMPVNVSPKYWAEHFGMPYHQAAIRDLELPKTGQVGSGLMTLSEGARSFTRYGYADLLRDDRRYSVRHRVFAGTQKILLSGDPAGMGAYGKRFSFCGSTGFDVMEPLTCRGRRGSGVEGARRSGYADAALEPRWDWRKYLYWYRLWGRLSYNPEADASVARRHFAGVADADALGAALAQASRILPIVTTAHAPSAACDAYWPELYWNQPMAGAPDPNPYGDTPAPKSFQHASPLDPQLFAGVDEHAGALLSGAASGKYTPIEVAHWLEDLAEGVDASLAVVREPASAEARRIVIDARMQAELGRFFAAKFRAGVLYALHERSGDREALAQALSCYRRARAAWAALVAREDGIYAADLSVSDRFSERGQWRDRLAGIDSDIAALEALTASATGNTDASIGAAIAAALAQPSPRSAPCVHTPPAVFHPNQDLSLAVTSAPGRSVTSVRCFYRRVNQAERYEETETRADGEAFRAIIPAAYTASPYPLQYYFVAMEGPAHAELCPGLGPELMNEPYYVVRRA
jgi:hypothetical protein